MALDEPSPTVALLGQNRPCWQVPPLSLALGEGEVHLWWASLRMTPSQQSHALDLLAADEIARFARLRSPADRRFAAARSILRRLLSQYLQCPPEALAFTYSDRGKPALQQPVQPLQFNLSHSGDVAVYAVARRGAIGVDVECIRPVVAWKRLARRYFSDRECAHLETLPEQNRTQAFLQIWTQKEAYVKATGEGIRGLATATCPEHWRCSTVELPGAVASLTSELGQAPQLFLWRSL